MGACLGSLCENNNDGGSIKRHRAGGYSGYSTNGSRVGADRGIRIHNPQPVPDFGISSHYRVMEMLGEGGTGQTWLCQDIRSARRVAIKFIPRPLAKVLVPMVSQEIQLQAQLSEGHLGLVRVESALLSRSHLGLVMEYIDGGTLTQYVTKRAANKGERGGLHLAEDEARYFFRQLISAVEYLHKSHVAHRDLKMCNVVLTQRRPPTLKLCDFGFAKGWDDSSVMNTRIGTPVYMSPQLIASKNEGKTYRATAADVWACGVLLFAMLLGRFPYDHTGHPDPNSSGAHIEVWTEQMKAGDGDWQQNPRVAPHIALLSDSCKDLLGKMLHTDEAQRIIIPDIRKHPWFATELPPHLDEALKEFEERQGRLEKVMEDATEQQLKRRNATVHDLIVRAGQDYSTPPSGAKPRHPGVISAIFESAVEGDCGSVTSSAHPAVAGFAGQPSDGSREEPASVATTDAGAKRKADKGSVAAADAAAESKPEKDEPDVIMIDLAAVAKRTKSDGLLLMAPFDPEGRESGRHCDSEDTDHAPECSLGGGEASAGDQAPPQTHCRTTAPQAGTSGGEIEGDGAAKDEADGQTVTGKQAALEVATGAATAVAAEAVGAATTVAAEVVGAATSVAAGAASTTTAVAAVEAIAAEAASTTAAVAADAAGADAAGEAITAATVVGAVVGREGVEATTDKAPEAVDINQVHLEAAAAAGVLSAAVTDAAPQEQPQ